MTIPFTIVDEFGVHFETGVPVCFRYVRNDEKSANFGGQFLQDIEPHGRFMLHNPVDHSLPQGWSAGRVCFKNPLVLAFNVQDSFRYNTHNWKAQLARHYKTGGLNLTKALIADGYDGIVTTKGASPQYGLPPETAEIVQLPKLSASGWDWSWGS